MTAFVSLVVCFLAFGLVHFAFRDKHPKLALKLRVNRIHDPLDSHMLGLYMCDTTSNYRTSLKILNKEINLEGWRGSGSKVKPSIEDV